MADVVPNYRIPYVTVSMIGSGVCRLGPLLLTWFNFNPSMDK